jgi:hypothetical protein
MRFSWSIGVNSVAAKTTNVLNCTANVSKITESALRFANVKTAKTKSTPSKDTKRWSFSKMERYLLKRDKENSVLAKKQSAIRNIVLALQMALNAQSSVNAKTV